jgi:hypothetical protein
MLEGLMKAIMVCLISLLLALPAGSAPRSLRSVDIYTVAETTEFIVEIDGCPYLSFPGARVWALREDDGYCPMPVDEVERALDAVEFPLEDLGIKLVIMPVPRRLVGTSSAEGRVVFLSPGRIPYPVEHVHYTLAHEVGHVVQHVLMPESREDLWREYRLLRGLEDIEHWPETHAYRLREIFAEDFRVLFGGPVAACGGSVENPDIIPPAEVEGLRDFMLSLVGRVPAAPVLNAYPNPFRDGLALSPGEEGWSDGARIILCDVRGRVVGRLDPPGGSETLLWDGRGLEGERVGPGVYFALVIDGRARPVCKVIKTSR